MKAGTAPIRGAALNLREQEKIERVILMEKYLVHYGSGESRENPGVGVDYMKADIDGVELYAEMPPVEGDETGTYEVLKTEILAQAQGHGIDIDKLAFWYD